MDSTDRQVGQGSRRSIVGLRRLFSRVLPVVLFCLWAPASPGFASLSESLSYLLDAGAAAEEDESFGQATAVGDFNGDGFDDLAVGAPTAEGSGGFHAGRVFVSFGGPDGLGAPSVVLSADGAGPGTDCEDSNSADEFGFALASGDFNGDERDDLAVGIPGKDIPSVSDNGAVQIYQGRVDSLFDVGACLSHARNGLPGISGPDAHFGWSLAVGNFQSDDFEDLVVGAPGALVDAGAGSVEGGDITVVPGSAAGLTVVMSKVLHLGLGDVPGTPESGDSFGYSLATGDLLLGLDVACDLVVGAPFKQAEGLSDVGAAAVLYGCTASGLSDDDAQLLTADAFGRPFVAGDEMGYSVAIGNFDCEGGHDVAVGVPGRLFVDHRPGAVWWTSGELLTGAVFRELKRPADGDVVFVMRFAEALAALPAPSPGCDDLVVGEKGSPAAGSSADGRVVVVPTDGEVLRGDRASEYLLSPIQEDALLGVSVSVGRFDGLREHVAAGVPRWSLPDVAEAGAVWILPVGPFFVDGFESGDLSAWSAVVGGP